ncbi:tRNA adenosine deaminase-associated protein [Streptomyces sp. NPDC029721]|uniref:tRNA adenosine deaminase-associated protein n=1 Tax=Streptomyces sp. NPDC029721 TaxID=3157090 RepID=UPI0033F77169
MTEHKNHRYAVAVTRRDDRWHCTRLDRTALTGLDEAIIAVRGDGTSGTVYGFFNADEAFFLVLRSTPAGTGLLLSDARAVHRHTLAAQVLDVLDTEAPDEDAPGPQPAGDLGIVADLGLSATGMQAVLGRPGALPHDQLLTIAERCGFAAEFERVRR